MNNNVTLNILKIVVIICSVFAILGRFTIAENLINNYMAVVNIISFIVSYNILLISTYSKIKRTYCMIANNDIKFRYQKAVMVFYLLIFVINICIWIFLWNEYLYSGNDYSLMNDILSIGSLCLAITSDLLADIFERMFSALF